MSDEGEKTCPLCAEEMDLTDQQLKPCKCGYEICVWCWHHIMDMAEKDETEGRCPACRNPYNKEKIVGTTASCGRLVSEMNVEKKLKSSKAKNKSSESRKQLASVRVIQRNLVYVVGLPLSFADEDLLHRREYFGQYGKVLKVSISRTASGAIQHFANSTCSVYITYSKEEEAVRCIQSVHGFVLDGKPLKACFGTTKYCHAWLRNVPCSNPDCLYLHEIGSQEDSFTKDEIISAYTRSRVQQITGTSNSTQRRSGNVLPPPADEYCNNTSASSGKPITKTAVNTNTNSTGARVSPPNSSSGRSAALPAGASWGARASNNQPLHSSTCSNGPLRKPDVCNVPLTCSTVAVSQNQFSSLHNDAGKMLVHNEESIISHNKSETEALVPDGKESNADRRIPFSESSLSSVHSANLPVNRKPHSPPTTKLPPNSNNIVDSSVVSRGHASVRDTIDATDGNIEDMCSDILLMGIHEDKNFENDYGQHIRETVTSQTSGTTANTSEVGFIDVQSDFKLGRPSQVTKTDLHEYDLLSFESQRLKDPEVATNRTLDFSHASYLTTHSDIFPPEFSKADASVSLDRQVIDKNINIPIEHPKNIPKSSEVSDVEYSNLFPSKEKRLLLGLYEGEPGSDNIPIEHPKNIPKSSEVNDAEYSNLFPSNGKRSLLGRYEVEPGSDSVDMGESSIISNILSIDFDPWDESLPSPQNLAKLLGENDKQGSFSVPGSRRIQNSNQSRFSFAREEETKSQFSGFGESIDYFASSQHPFGHEPCNINNLHLEKSEVRNGFPVLNGMESDIFTGSHSHLSYQIPVSRSQISAPPGFSVPGRSAPPGFTSHDRADQVLDTVSGNYLLDASSLLRHIQTPSSANNISSGDIEFMDPAILAVGKGIPGGINGSGADFSSSYSSQLGGYEEARFQSLLQRSLPSHQNQRYTDLGESFSPLGDSYRVPSRVMEQTLANNISPFSQFTLSQSRNGIMSNGQWDGWNEVQAGNNLGMAELLRTERLGFNKFYGGYEDSKIRMPSSGNLFNGTYGI